MLSVSFCMQVAMYIVGRKDEGANHAGVLGVADKLVEAVMHQV